MTTGELRADGLVKAYRKRRVVDGVRFRVKTGEVVGLLGAALPSAPALGPERADTVADGLGSAST